jgi:hypothetical protein
MAEKTFSDTKINIKIAHPAALQANLDAYRRYPFERRYRHQLMLTMGALLKAAYGDVTVTKEAADQAYRISRTAAPYMPAIKMTRLEYLLNNELWRTEGDEVDELLGWLTVHASLQPGVWLADGAYALRIGDVPRLVAAINTGMALPTETHRPGFELLAGYLRTETETPS